MPLQRLAFQEVAARFSQPAVCHNRGTHQLPEYRWDATTRTILETDGTGGVVNGDQGSSRLPSRRPLDRRWDRSRGILLSENRRSAIREYTWPPVQTLSLPPSGILSSHQAHSYSSRTPPPKPNFGGSKPAQAAPKPTVMGPTLQPYGGRSSGESLEREKKYEEGQRAVSALQASRTEQAALQGTIHRLEVKLQALQKSYDSLSQQYKRLVQESEEWEKNSQDKLQEERRKAREEALKDKARRVEQARQELENVYEKRLAIAENRPVAAEEKLNAEMRRASRAMSQVEDLEARRDSLEEKLRKIISENEAEKKSLQSQHDEEVRRVRARASRDVEIAGHEALARVHLRVDYKRYRDVYSDLRVEVGSLLWTYKALAAVRKDTQKYWENAQQKFQAFCAQQKKAWFSQTHEQLVQKIETHLDHNLHRTKDISHKSESLMQAVSAAHYAFDKSAHDHRQLTRWLRFENTGDYHEMSHNADMLSLELVHRLEHFNLEHGRRRNTVKSYTQSTQHLFDLVRQMDFLKAVRHDEMGAKAVYLQTSTHKNIYHSVNAIRNAIRRSRDRKVETKPLNVLHKAIEEIDSAYVRARQDMAVYSDIVRKEAVLKASLGIASNDEKRYNLQIEELLKSKETELWEASGRIMGTHGKLTQNVAFPGRTAFRSPQKAASTTSRRLRQTKAASPGLRQPASRLTIRRTPSMQAAHVTNLPGLLLPKQEEVAVDMALLPDDFGHRRSPEDHSSRVGFNLADTSTNEAAAPRRLPLDGNAKLIIDDPSPASCQAAPDMHSPTNQADSSYDVENGSAIQNHQPLCFQIPAEDFKNAITASRTTSAAFWKHTLYRGPEGQTPRYHYCTSFETAETQAKQFLEETVLGFDIEWEARAKLERSSIKDNVSLIQIAAEDKIGLFHVARFRGETVHELMPPTLRQILESPDILKAGVNVVGDSNRMKKCLNVEMRGLFELSHLYKVVRFSEKESHKVNRVPYSLAKQVQEVLHLPLKKDEVRTSAWSKRLNAEQCLYAASDAYAGFRLFDALEAKRKAMDPIPPRPALYELHQPLVLGDGTEVMPRPKPVKDKSGADGKTAEADDDEGEEFFDALETHEQVQEVYGSAGVPLTGITYPSLPLLENLNVNAEASSANAATSRSLTSFKTPTTTPRGPIPSSPEAATAENWLTAYRSQPLNQMTTPANLRAYHLWHYQQKSVPEIAAMLRETPLSTQTVASYVMQALKEAKLPFDSERMTEVLELLPSSVRWRYSSVLRRAERSVS